MALVKICDICGDKCKSGKRYELIRKGILNDHTLDICCDCVDRIRKEIEESKINLKEGID